MLFTWRYILIYAVTKHHLYCSWYLEQIWENNFLWYLESEPQFLDFHGFMSFVSCSWEIAMTLDLSGTIRCNKSISNKMCLFLYTFISINKSLFFIFYERLLSETPEMYGLDFFLAAFSFWEISMHVQFNALKYCGLFNAFKHKHSVIVTQPHSNVNTI